MGDVGSNPDITWRHRVVQGMPWLANFAIGAAALVHRVSASPGHGLRMLYLHSVPNRQLPSFKRLVSRLQQHYQFLTTEEAANAIASGEAMEGRFLHVSFDDGFENNFGAAEVLRTCGVPGTFFVATAYIDGETGRLDERFRLRYGQQKPMTWEQLRTMQSWGMEIGSHTVSHPRFVRIEDAEVQRELSESKARMEEELQREIKSFSFPYGRKTDFLPRHARMAREAGYRWLFTTELEHSGSDLAHPECFGRYGCEPFLSSRSTILLLNGLLAKYR